MLTAIGDYRVDSQLGCSAHSAVYLAVDTRNQRSCALRVFDQAVVGKDFLPQLQQLQKTMKRIDCEQVVAIDEVGECSEGPYMAQPLVPGGDLQELLRRNGGVLELAPALILIRDLCTALDALYPQGLHHHDLKPSALVLDLSGRASLCGAGIMPLISAARPAEKTLSKLAYCAPEVAAGFDDADVRADIFSLGALLFRCLSGTLLFDDPDPLTLLHLVRKGKIPDLDQALPQVPASLRTFIARCCERQPEKRFATPLALKDALDALAKELQVNRRAGAAIDALDALSNNRQALRAAIDPAQLLRLTKMIRILDGGLSAVIRLAPGASFKRAVLDLIVAEAGVRFGIDHAALSEATRPLEQVRQVIIARGQMAAPGANGCNVHGDPIPPPLTTVQIHISEDGLQAQALIKPGTKIEAADLAAAREQADLRFGVIEEAMAKLSAGRALPVATLLVAQGTVPQPPRHAGWEVLVAKDAQGAPPSVRRGDKVARWQAARAGVVGRDVRGEEILVSEARQAQPEEISGQGVDLQRDHGQALLLANCDGAVIYRANGMVEVRAVLEIDGDVDGKRPPIESDAVVVIRGNLNKGGVVQSSADVIICGDVNGGEISAGGDVEISGVIAGEGPPVNAGGTISAAAVDGRVLVAGSLQVSGALRSARIHVAGNVSASSIVGGEVVCGGSIECEVLGDGEGMTTVARCGAHLKLAERQLVARLRWQKVSADRRHLLSKRDSLLGDQTALEQRSMRHRSASVSCAEALTMMQNDVERIDQQLSLIRTQADGLREEVQNQFQAVAEVDEVREAAHIIARRCAHPGVQASIADSDPEQLGRERHRYCLQLNAPSTVDGQRGSPS